MNTKKIIKTENLSKEFDKVPAVSNFSIDLYQGKIYGLLGANGAGKTTFLKLLSGLLEPSEGAAFILDKNSWSNRSYVLKNLGLLIEMPYFYEHLSAKENLAIHLEYMNVKGDINSTLEKVGLKNLGSKKLSQFSMGMRQRLAIARAIIHKPAILILDEPINGLDPVAIQDIREIFVKLSKEGTTILLSSHILSEIFHTVNHVIIMANGKLIETDSLENYKNQHGTNLENYLIQKMRGEY